MTDCRKRKRFSLSEKLDILREFDKNVGPQNALAERLKISTSTLATIVKQRAEIEKASAECGGKSSKIRKSMKVTPLSVFESDLVEWFNIVRAKKIAISGPMIKEKALQLAEKHNLKDFSASNGWIDRFKKRYDIVQKKVCGEKADVNENVVKDWEEKLLSLIEGYSPSNIYNADETGLFYDLQPDKTLCYKNEKCFGGKKSKMRLTVLLAVNADGTDKLKPFVIGRAVKPRCFKNVKTLPTTYVANKKSWMTSSLFKDYLTSLDKSMKIQKKKILLFIDQCPAHPPICNLENVKVLFFPANCTSVLQPLDLGIIRTVKVNYRKLLMRKITESLDENAEKRYKANVLDALYFVRQSWDQVSKTTIEKCFQKAGFPGTQGESDENDEDIAPLEEVAPGIHFNDYLTCDDGLSICATEVNEIFDLSESMNSNSDLENDETPIETVTFSNAVRGLETVKTYLMQQYVNDSVFSSLHTVEKELFRVKNQGNFQTTLTQYFKISN